MRDTEENCWLLLDMARAMGGYGYDEMWWADVYEPDDLEYSAPTLYEAFVHSDDYDPGAHWVRRKEYGDGFESVKDDDGNPARDVADKNGRYKIKATVKGSYRLEIVPPSD